MTRRAFSSLLGVPLTSGHSLGGARNVVEAHHRVPHPGDRPPIQALLRGPWGLLHFPTVQILSIAPIVLKPVKAWQVLGFGQIE